MGSEVITKVDGDIVDKARNEAANERMIIFLKNPIIYERETYTKIDLTGLENMCAEDMIAVNRVLTRNGNVDVNPELSMEYALTLAARATSIPIEFYEKLPMSVAMKIKGRVMGFLYRQE